MEDRCRGARVRRYVYDGTGGGQNRVHEATDPEERRVAGDCLQAPDRLADRFWRSDIASGGVTA